MEGLDLSSNRDSSPQVDKQYIGSCRNTRWSDLQAVWQLNADGNRLIGHMRLQRQIGLSLGLKVTGGRPTAGGQLCALITNVKKGSVADLVGQLRPGSRKINMLRMCIGTSVLFIR